MALRLRGHVELPAHRGQGGFDHAAVHHRLGLLYLAHTANDALAVFDGARAAFCVNIAGPPWIQIVDARTRLVTRTIPLAATGPHGLDLDAARRRLFCACDDGALIEVDLETWAPATRATLSGPPDVIFFNAHLRHLYVAVGEPGVIDVLDTESWRRIETMPTERGAHTLAFDARHDTVYAFLPESHRAAVYQDS